MLKSAQIQRRQSELREELAALAANDNLTDENRTKLDMLDREYQDNEKRYRAALISEDTERKEATEDLEGRSEQEWSDLLKRFEVQQVALALDEGRALSGPTAEIVEEFRSKGGYRGIPLPIEALNTRAGETVAGGTPDPIQTMPIVDRIFAATTAARMGAQFISIPQGEREWPVVTSSVSAGWADGETASVAGPTAFATTDKALAPDQNLGVQMKITRKTLKQSGAALEQAVRRDMLSAIEVELDKAVFRGAGSSGEPLGVIAGVSTYSITDTDVSAAATWSVFRAAITRFMTANAVNSPTQVKLMIRPEVWDTLDGTADADLNRTEWERLVSHIGAANIVTTSNALAAPTGTPAESQALLTTPTGGVAPVYVGLWGAVDVIRDPYSDAASGGLRLTGLLTADVTVARPAQLEVLSGIQ
ncbi:phage major capsid protein [Parvularcula sp. IMCC14364]|uniref:phage major capsid protein n=1 Tax=Parvularcula sp. IMCC14364 TaxID=3067902 RepID=UPI00274276C2|nr:phage major capsid protein [Parvularcula sp. IMCC14364]